MLHQNSAIRLMLCLAAMVCLSITTAIADDIQTEDIVIGSQYKLSSEILGEEMTISIYLPYGYEDSKDSYPVFYLLNGESKYNLAAAATAIEDLDGKGKVPQMIVVGFGSPNNRRDYFPFQYQDRKESGQGDRFLEFVTKELIPWTDRTFRTNSYRILCGASNAGLLTVHALFSQPESFNAYIAPSPSIGWFTDSMLARAAAAFESPEIASHPIYMNYATDDLQRIVTSAMPDFTKAFETDAPAAMRWKMEILDSAGHVPFISIHNGLLFLFPDWQYTHEMALEGGLAGVKAHYAGLSERFGFTARAGSGLLIYLGGHYFRGEDWPKAIEVFQFYAGQYPGSARAQFFLGESYRRNGNNEQAIECYKKTLEIDPEYTRATSRLKELGVEI